jgi:uncharacterized protein YcbK (DUF882 family)
MKVTANFSKHEFDCSDGTEMPLQVFNNVIELAENLEVLRAHFNAPITINSAWRTATYNRQVGGAVNSQHLSGKASDVVVSGVPPEEVANAIEFLIECGLMKEGGVGRYDTFTHYDIRGTKARWDFRSEKA